MSAEPILLAIDPGREKCGIAILSDTGVLRVRHIFPSEQMETELPKLAHEQGVTQIVLGNATSSRQWQEFLAQHLPQLPVAVIDETGSTLEARVLYWQFNPPRGWRRWLPISLQMPPEPLDDFAAVVLARRWLQDNKSSPLS